MAEHSATPRARIAISCLEAEWERIREVAEGRGVSINDHVISAGLNVRRDPAQTDAPALALSEAEQRRLLDRVGSATPQGHDGAGCCARADRGPAGGHAPPHRHHAGETRAAPRARPRGMRSRRGHPFGAVRVAASGVKLATASPGGPRVNATSQDAAPDSSDFLASERGLL